VKRALQVPALAVLAIAALFAAACGGTASVSPSAVATSRAASAGAVITGRVTGIGTASTAGGAGISVLAATSVTVSIVGTNISTAVDGNGQFTLTGVPPGTVALRFSARGADATITLTGVTATDRIDITVTLNGGDARVDSERRGRDGGDNDDENDNELEGTVSAITGACPALTFTVAGTTVKTTSATTFEDGPCTRIANGSRVEVKGTRGTDTFVTATKVESKNS